MGAVGSWSDDRYISYSGGSRLNIKLENARRCADNHPARPMGNHVALIPGVTSLEGIQGLLRKLMEE